MRAALVALSLSAVCAASVMADSADHRSDAPRSGTPQSISGTLLDSLRYVFRVTDGNLMGITVTNYGFIGNNFFSRTPSMEYPLGTGYEHLVRGGLWVGAHAVDDSGAFVGVSAGTVDGRTTDGSPQSATEFTPASSDIGIHSTLPNSHYFDRHAVSEQDFISLFSDRPARRAANNSEEHRPVDILVRLENYAWSFSAYQHFVIFHYTITNLGPPLANVWVGMYSELASGPKNGYNAWPPSTNDASGNGFWFSKKWVQYNDTLRMIQEHYCIAQPIPSACVLERVPEWVGVKLLGTGPEPLSTKQVTLAAWRWSPGDTLRDFDSERYALMSAGTIQDLSGNDFLPQTGDPVTLLAAGPFAQINHGDTISVDFALCGGDGLTDPSALNGHAEVAQRAFDRHYVVPVPPPSPRLKVIARNQALDLYWDKDPEAFADTTGPYPLDFEGYRVYVGDDRNHLKRIAQFDLATPPHDTTGFNTGLDAVRRDTTIDGVSYSYRYTVPALKNGFKYFVAVTSYDLGNVEIESLESGIPQNKTLAIPNPAAGEFAANKVYVYPNPYRVEAAWDRGKQTRDHYLWFTNLPPHCMVRIYTLSGDIVYETEFVGSTYQGGGTRGVYDPAHELDVDPPTMSGTTLAWNMITRMGQAAATGLYMYSVENLNGGTKTLGKFLIVKSDQEGP
jgi:hypothetical protein